MEDKLLWTPSTIALWNDKKFIEKRIKEQGEYTDQLVERSGWRANAPPMSKDREHELKGCAYDVYIKLLDRLEELNSDVAELVQAPH